MNLSPKNFEKCFEVKFIVKKIQKIFTVKFIEKNILTNFEKNLGRKKKWIIIQIQILENFNTLYNLDWIALICIFQWCKY